ncbi:MAG TPA: alpha/beta fold hydrolase [Microlunatus sp.]|nr:alpha/beta fold hydrolase [Microlunatus sp.]
MSSRDHLTGPPPSASASGIHVEVWGAGEPVILVHGSLATGVSEWVAQRPLADAGYSLRVVDRRGYGCSASAVGEDYLADARDIIELMSSGAHLVGHSYGGLGALLAAAREPEAIRSLTLLEPATAAIAEHDAAWRRLVADVRNLWGQDLADREWVIRFLEAVGSDPDQFPPEMLDEAIPLVQLFRRGRPFHQAELPLAEVAAGNYPKLVVSGGHHPGFDAMCSDLATRIGARYAVVEGAGHEIQFVGEPLNTLLLQHWEAATP